MRSTVTNPSFMSTIYLPRTSYDCLRLEKTTKQAKMLNFIEGKEQILQLYIQMK
jgi:hypothetical protein